MAQTTGGQINWPGPSTVFQGQGPGLLDICPKLYRSHLRMRTPQHGGDNFGQDWIAPSLMFASERRLASRTQGTAAHFRQGRYEYRCERCGPRPPETRCCCSCCSGCSCSGTTLPIQPCVLEVSLRTPPDHTLFEVESQLSKKSIAPAGRKKGIQKSRRQKSENSNQNSTTHERWGPRPPETRRRRSRRPGRT